MGVKVVDLGRTRTDFRDCIPGRKYTYAERDAAVSQMIFLYRKEGIPEDGIRSILRGRGDMTAAEIEGALKSAAMPDTL